jgi:hypothetical protein
MNTEYRKAMYRNGEYTSVGNADEEAVKRAEGWTDWYTDQDRMNGKKAAIGKFEPPADAVTTPAPDAFTFAPEEPAKRKPGRPPKAK